MGKILRVLICCLVPTGAFAQDTCSQLVSRLKRGLVGDELVESRTGATYKSLYDTCDASNTFAGEPLPLSSGRRVTCSGDKNRVGFIAKFEKAIVFSAKGSVDADGSKFSCGAGWPNQCGTWLEFDRGSQRKDVNAEDTSFVVVPGAMPGKGISFRGDTRIGAGDLAVAISGNRCTYGVVGDSGPYFRLGELSLKAHQELGNPQCAVPGQYPCRRLRFGSGVSIPSDVKYIIFPGTRPVPLHSQTVNTVARREAEAAAKRFLAEHP